MVKRRRLYASTPRLGSTADYVDWWIRSGGFVRREKDHLVILVMICDINEEWEGWKRVGRCLNVLLMEGVCMSSVIYILASN